MESQAALAISFLQSVLQQKEDQGDLKVVEMGEGMFVHLNTGEVYICERLSRVI